MKIALVQLNYLIGDFDGNVARIIASIKRAKKDKADLAVFAELAICGYPPRDFLTYHDFTHRAENAIKAIAAETKGLAVVVGSPGFSTADKGKELFNSAYFLKDGKIEAIRHKSLLPNYDIFDEYRYFEPNRQFDVVNFKDHRIALTICEDIWNTGYHPLYVVNPMDEIKKQNPSLMINIAASPFHYHKAENRTEVITDNAKRYGIPVVYVNHVGGQTELLFDGGSLVAAPDGSIVHQLKFFEEDYKIIDLNDLSRSESPVREVEECPDKVISRIHRALVMGVKDYFGKLGFSKAILGLSGGIDSAVTLALAVEALGADNVLSVLMPSRFSSEHSVSDAQSLVKNLGSPSKLISIEEAFNSFEKTLEPHFEGRPFNITEENIQARIRAVILMALSNKFGYILLNTSNKSEAAVGYGTLYGDMCGGLSLLGDVYKTQVYDLAKHINRYQEIIPVSTITKPPSAELRPGQKDSDSLPEYSLLDQILHCYIERRLGPDEIIGQGFDALTVHRVLKMVNTTEFKRYQSPPILRVSPQAFGPGRRMPIVAKYLS